MKQKKSMKILGIFIFLFIFMFTFVSSESCSLSVSLVNQDPYPAIPGDYVDVVFQVGGIDNPECNGAVIELVPSYPFSLDEDDAMRTLSGSSWIANYESEWMVPYTVRVDADAFDGDAVLKVNYGQRDAFVSQDFDIVIQDSRTYFDSVIQEISESEVSIAIANTGEYTANSVIVRIPEQENFVATGTTGQMVGNLDAGDYTIVSFSLSSITHKNIESRDNINESSSNQNNLNFDIYYTDALGERRTVNVELPLQMTSGLSTLGGDLSENFAGRTRMQEESGTNWTLWIIVGVVAILGFVLFKKYPRQTKDFYNKSKQKITKLFHKKKHADSISNVIPDWIKNAKNKEKKN